MGLFSHNIYKWRRGGARKFGRQFLEIAGLQLDRADELKRLAIFVRCHDVN